MAMYLMKPYYATRGGHKTTTYDTTYTTSRTSLYYSQQDSTWLTNMYSCPSFTTYSTYSVHGTYGDYICATYGITLPKLYYSDINTTGQLYNMYSSNRTVITLSDSSVTTSVDYGVKSNTSSSARFFAGLDDDIMSFVSNSNNVRYGYSSTCPYNSVTISNASPAYYELNAYPSLNSRDLISEYFRRSQGSKTLQKSNVVWFEISDPTKVTLIVDNYAGYTGYDTSNRVIHTHFNTRKVTMYRATLSETTI